MRVGSVAAGAGRRCAPRRHLNFTLDGAPLFTKYAKVFIIICLALVVIAPWFLSGRHRRRNGLTGSDTSDGSGGDGYSHHGHFADHGGNDGGGHGGGDGGH